MSTLPLNNFADVTYTLAGTGAPRQGFNLGLIVGTSTVISTATRVVVYDSLAAVADAGFSLSSPEYLAAVRYFNATSRPPALAIGRQGTGETPLAAVTACRLANPDWYIVYVPGATNSDHEDIAEYIEALEAPYSQYFMQTSDADVKNGVASNIFEILETGQFERTHGLFSSSAHAIAGVMGYAMGQTSDFVNSAYTLKFKTLPGVTTESLTSAQVTTILGYNGNVYVNRGSFYNMYEPGMQFSGDWFDEIIYLDKLANEVQINVANLLYLSPKIPQTEDGMAQLRAVAAAACQNLVNIGFIAPGKWTGQPILTLNTNDYLPGGYIVMSDSIDTQSSVDRANRIAPNIYVAVKLAGSIHSVMIMINVNR